MAQPAQGWDLAQLWAPPTKTTKTTTCPHPPQSSLGAASTTPACPSFLQPLVSPHPTPCLSLLGDDSFTLGCLSHLSSCTTSLDKARHIFLDSQLQVSSLSRGLHCQVMLPVMLHWAGMARGKGRKGSCCWLLIALSTYTGTATGIQLRVRTRSP